MAPSTPVLSLTTVNPEISIDGERYTLRVREDLSILTNTDYAKKFGRIENMRRLNRARTPKEETEFKGLLTSMASVVLDAPATVLERLTLSQKLSVVTAFFRSVASLSENKPAHASTRKK